MSSVAIVKDDRYMEHDAGEGHLESPNRLRVIHDLIEKEFGSLPLIPPRLATENELALVHDPFYIQTVASTEGKLFSMLDPDTWLSARSYEIARLAVGGLLEAVDRILDRGMAQPVPTPHSALDTPHSVFAFVRPPGHHAEPSRGMGFCLFNNIAIAAEYAKEKHGLKRILIVDWDLHHGNGTQWAFYEDPMVLFFSSHQYPYYPGSGNFDEVGNGPGEGYTVNAPFPTGFGDAEYIHVYDTILKPIALEFRPELVLVSAGFDPYFRDPLGGMEVTGEGFGALAAIVRDIAQQTCDGKVLITLEGGYNPQGLREGVRSVLNSLQGQTPHAAARTPSPAAEQVIKKITAVHGRYWKNLG
jgi:acetoin utilization deacetylase AcuC-like enzyme